MEVSAGRTERGASQFDEYGATVSGFLQTDRWGTFSVDATVARSQGSGGDAWYRDGDGWRALITVWQRNFFLKNGWKLDNGVGVLNTPSVPVLRNQYRFFLPSVPFAGGSVEATSPDGAVQITGAAGRAGVFNGTRLAGFETEPGHVATVGGQWGVAPGWTVGAAFLGTDNQIVSDSQGQAVLADGRTNATHAAVAWEGARDRLQGNVLRSGGDQGRALGAWVDGSSRRGRYTHHYGAFRLEPKLSWGALPISNDAQGAYYRLAYQHARWNWSGGVDQIQSISGDGFDGAYATGYARYQSTASLGYGASANVRSAPDFAYSYQLFMDKRTRWGQTRVQWDQADTRTPGGSQQWQVSVDQAWPTKTGASLSTSVGYGETGWANEPTTGTWQASVLGSHALTDRLSIDGSVRWRQEDGLYASRGTDANIGLSWRANANWSASAAFYQSQGSQRSPFVIDPLAPDNPFVILPKDRSFFFTVRYQRSAGRAQGVLGGAPGAPYGALRGAVFLDENGDGVRAASEQGAANVTVVLDGRYAVRTDSEGRYEFPRVSVGAHTVEVQSDNLPLPWTLEGRQTVNVGIRSDAAVDFGATRPR